MNDPLNCVELHRKAVHKKLEIEFQIRAQSRDFASVRTIDLENLKINEQEAAELDRKLHLACEEVADTHLDMIAAMHKESMDYSAIIVELLVEIRNK
jgi:hypothetical protein